MNRREFVCHLALIAAGTAALPQQIAAFEKLFDVNLPQKATGLLQMHDLLLGFGGVPCDEVARFELLSGPRVICQFVMNTRASMRYVTTPDCPILSTVNDLSWRITGTRSVDIEGNEHTPAERFEGTIRLTDQDARIHNISIDGTRTQLRDYLL